MASRGYLSMVLLVFEIVLAAFANSAFSTKPLSPNFHDQSCPNALNTIKQVVEAAVKKEPRMGASLLRLHFQDCFVNLGGPTWKVNLGRRDSTNASRVDANNNLPAPTFDLPQLIDNFNKQGLDQNDLVLLPAAHTMGFARCVSFRNRTYNDSNINPFFSAQLQTVCPRSGGDENLAPLDSTPANFDVSYFLNLVQKKGLLHSDQALFNGGSTDALVILYSLNPQAFYQGFASSMIKMGNIKPLTGNQGEIRVNCRSVN